jgi:hypothetical protein
VKVAEIISEVESVKLNLFEPYEKAMIRQQEGEELVCKNQKINSKLQGDNSYNNFKQKNI